MRTRLVGSPASPFGWPGAKRDLYPEIRRYFPPPGSGDLVVSPFLGGGSVELGLASEGYRVRASDICRPLIDLWGWLMCDASRLADKVLEMTGPLPMDEPTAKRLMGAWYGITPNTLNIESAALTYIHTRVSWGAKIPRRTPSREKLAGFVSVDSLREFECEGLELYLQDYEMALATRPWRAPVYCDPPYWAVDNLYPCPKFDHKKFAERMRDLPGPWAVSYDDCPEVRAAFEGERIIELETVYKLKHGPRVELLIVRDGAEKSIPRQHTCYRGPDGETVHGPDFIGDLVA